MRLQFLGASGNVTGSCYLLEANGSRILIDHGMFQERDYQERNWERCPVEPESMQAVLLTHAHIDHSGLIPKLYADGFAGQTYATPATVDLAEIMLLDSAHIQEEDARYKSARHRVEGRPPKGLKPLYTEQDVLRCLPRLRSVPYERDVLVAPGITATWYDAGHMLGSAHIRVRVDEGGRTTTIAFSGDVGQMANPILRSPTHLDFADIVVCESTYGDRKHPTRDDAMARLGECIASTLERGGNLVIPSFAVGRTQELLFFLKTLLTQERIPELPTFVDSPMAIRATEMFQRHPEAWNESFAARVFGGEDPLYTPKVHFTREAEESRAIALYPPTTLIISASGMCNAGRIKHHLVNNISDPRSTVLFIGYQAEGTLGRLIVEKHNPVRILGSSRDVKARIESISGFSAHADVDGLCAWVGAFGTSPKRVFVTHGEPRAANAFRDRLSSELDCPITIPSLGDSFELP
ncbi:MBL fold metallo-hydrolase [Candidatus Poribacteria bacterium]|nr:MBL fold metallo-hydrolase [Candidatus Poribacteria bacterium]